MSVRSPTGGWRSALHAVLTAVLIMLPASPAAAQLGETPDGCAKTYGPSVQQLPSVLEGGDATAQSYRRKNLHITVHFKNGRAWHVAYSQPFLSDAERSALLVENAGTAKWRRPLGERVGNVLVWMSENNSVVVSAFEAPDVMLFEVMTRACAADLSRQRDQRVLSAQKASLGLGPRPGGSK